MTDLTKLQLCAENPVIHIGHIKILVRKTHHSTHQISPIMGTMCRSRFLKGGCGAI